MSGCKETVHVDAAIDSPPVKQSLPKQPTASWRKKAETGRDRPLVTLRKVYKAEYKRN